MSAGVEATGWRRMVHSLRFRLTAWYCLMVLATVAALALVFYLAARRELVRHHDSELEAAARAVIAILQEHEDCARLSPAQSARLDEIGGLVLVHDVAGTGQVFYRSPNSIRLPLPRGFLDGTDLSQRHAAFDTHVTSSGLTRVYTAPYESRAGRQGLIRILEPLGDVEAPLATLRGLLLLMAPVALVVSFAGGLWLADRALRPVDRITTMARDIEAQNLSLRIPPMPVRDEMGRLVETLNQMITRLEASFAGMRAFTADASHELRTPLASIVGTVDVVLAQPRTPAEYERALRSVAEDAQGLRVIVDDLLVLAQADAGAVTVRREPVRMDRLVAEVAEGMEPAAVSAGVVLSTTVAGAAVIHGDEPWLRQLLTNVLDNAIKFAARGTGPPSVLVDLSVRGEYAIIAVRDSGPGVPEELLPLVFDRFCRGDESRARGEGAGLGLAICAWVVQSHGGTIELGNLPGGGATCVVRLPMRPPPHHG